MKKNLIYSSLVALFVSVTTIGAFQYFDADSNKITIQHVDSTPSKNAIFSLDNNGNAIPVDFNETAEAVLDGVVHIKSSHLYSGNNLNYQYQNIPEPFKDFFGDQFFSPRKQQRRNDNYLKKSPTRVGSGSGVIISKEGYIVTNNHVVAEADDLEVTLHDNRTYKARVVGTDPSTDLALLQIKAKDLPTVPITDSDNVNIGQWVLAVGNPMGLNSTVTAGIVSAKGRNINILKDKYAIENFIQTDAAINPGNSGGALVDLNGGLIGINTAISSPTGVFAGYGFAVPANIVSKVVKDLMEYGVVQRGVLGVMIRTIDGNFAKEKEIELTRGVYVDSLLENSAAEKAGIEVGDIIQLVDNIEINSSPELQGVIARYRPGEKVKIKIDRNGKEKEIAVTLNNREGNTAMIDKDTRAIIKILGVELERLDSNLASKLEIDGGVKVKKLYTGKIRKFTQMREGFIITKVNGEKVKSKDQLLNLLEKKKGGVMLEGIYEEIPGEYFYAFGMP